MHTHAKTIRTMRTKALILSAAVSLAAVVSAMAQTTNVYSVNAVGYVTISLTNGYNLIANPLNATSNNLNTVLTNVADSATFIKWLPGSQGFKSASSFFAGFGWVPDDSWKPGEAGFLFSPDNRTMTFVGEVPQGTFTNSLGVGYSMVSSVIPQSGALTNADFNFPAGDSDTFLSWNAAARGYDSATTYFAGFGWSPTTPNLQVGQGFFVFKSVSTNWVRTFSANN